MPADQPTMTQVRSTSTSVAELLLHFEELGNFPPSSSRIKQGMPKLTHSMKTIVDAKCCVAPGLGSSGKRHDSNGKKSSSWGEKRARSANTFKEHWTCDDAME